MISARVGPGGSTLLVAPVRGLTSEAALLAQALDAFRPDTVGLGASAEEFEGLDTYFVRSGAEPIVPLSPGETSEVRGLVRFGEVSVPNPSFVRAIDWAQGQGIRAEPLDPSDDRSASLFAEHIGYLELVRRTVRERGVGRRPPAPSTPDQFALEWDREVSGGRGSRAFARARDRHLVREARRLVSDGGRVAVVVDRERFDEVRELFDREPPSSTESD